MALALRVEEEHSVRSRKRPTFVPWTFSLRKLERETPGRCMREDGKEWKGRTDHFKAMGVDDELATLHVRKFFLEIIIESVDYLFNIQWSTCHLHGDASQVCVAPERRPLCSISVAYLMLCTTFRGQFVRTRAGYPKYPHWR